jgi:hypothetical protein
VPGGGYANSTLDIHKNFINMTPIGNPGKIHSHVAWTEQTGSDRKAEQENFSGVISTTTKLPQHQAGFGVSARKIIPA